MKAGAERRALPFDPIEEAARQWEDHGWGDAAPGMAAVTSVVRLHQVFLARADALLAPYRLTFSRYEVLMLLSFSRTGALPLGKIGERLQVHQASVTNSVDRLEGDGLVRRRPNPDDGRGTLAAITARGRRTVGRATADMNARLFTEVGLTTRELDTLFRLLRKVRRAEGDFA